ncbi:MAG TPA: PKD domain-containing protein [Solirubrobacterales bacterium]|nr:PKD domain-containing protein [Solirubrobacterales bacterium]
MATMLLFSSPARAVDQGIVEVDGYSWSGDSARVNLNSLGGGTTVEVDGQDRKVFSLLEILTEAQSSTSELDLAALPKVEIAYPKSELVTYSGSQIRDSSRQDKLARFFVGEGGWTYILLPGNISVAFEKANPKIYDPSKIPALNVTLSPKSKEIESGDRVDFRATVTNAGGKPLQYEWIWGDGNEDQTSTGNYGHTFRGKNKSFWVTVTVSGPGFKDGQDAATITIGKVEKPKNKKKKKDKEDPPADEDTGGYGGYSYPGGTGGYGGYPGGTGTSPGAGTPMPAAPEPKPQPEPSVDDGLVEVTGELVSSSAPAPTMTPGEAAAQPPPVAVAPTPEGFKISSETWTVLGLLALLGLGLLAERRGSKLY